MLLQQFYMYDIKIEDNFNVHFLTFLAYKVDPLSFTGRSIHLRLVPSMLCFSDKWSVVGHFHRLDNKLAIKGPINCLDQIFWTCVRLVILWPLVYFQVVSMKINPEISILSFLALFFGCALFASSFWQCPNVHILLNALSLIEFNKLDQLWSYLGSHWNQCIPNRFYSHYFEFFEKSIIKFSYLDL